jgi:geranylgeranyl pyrophosphate synthase
VERSAIETVVEKDEMTMDDFCHVSGLVKQYGGITYTVDTARRYIDECRSQLAAFETTPVTVALLGLAEYVVTRNR